MSKSKKKSAAPAELTALYDHLVSLVPEIERKGATMPYTSCNGHMFSFLSKEGEMGLRLPKAEREAFMEEHNAELSIQYGRVMKEYVAVPAPMLKDAERMKEYLEISLAYIKSLKPKPTKKKKS